MMDIIRERRSVRTFDGKNISDDEAVKILEFAQKVENPYDIGITWKILDAKKEGLSSAVIAGTNTYIAGKLLRVPHAEEAFGYSFEKVVLFAKSLGIGTTMIGGTMNRSAFERAMNISGQEFLPCVSPLGYPAKKMSFKETMMRKGIKADTRFDFGEVFFDGSFDNPLSESKAGKLCEAFEAVRLAPSAVNKQPWRLVLCDGKVHFYEKRSKGFASGDGSDMQKIDMGIALCHFEVVAMELGVSVLLKIEDPGLEIKNDMVYIASFDIG
ncbi:MAG: nitroreductase [Lachnospiraceae bacterium]|nr:nitroreductase [Lachnospiraceae bacterium]